MAIYGRLTEGLPNSRFFLEGVPESTEVPVDPTGMIKPFASLWFGQLTDTGRGTQDSDLCGVGGGTSVRQGAFLVQCVAPTGLSILQFEDAIRVLLTGFSPAGQGELTEGGATSIRDPLPTGLGVGLRFYKPVFFSGLVGAPVTTAIPALLTTPLKSFR